MLSDWLIVIFKFGGIFANLNRHYGKHIKLFNMETLIYFITRIVIFACISLIGYIIAMPEKKVTDESDIW